MNLPILFRALPAWLAFTVALHAQEKAHVAPAPASPAPAAVEGVKGVKQEAVQKVKNVESGITTGAKNTVEAVNKIDGVQTINGVKADGQTVVIPVKPVVQPVISGAGSIHAVNGVTGINTAKLQNLEAALQLKHGETGPPNGKGRAAAADLLGPPGGKPGPKPKEDGRAGFQEFEKLQNAGS
jgi:hypothetical protein